VGFGHFQGLRFRVWDVGFGHFQGLRCRVQAPAFRVEGPELCDTFTAYSETTSVVHASQP